MLRVVASEVAQVPETAIEPFAHSVWQHTNFVAYDLPLVALRGHPKGEEWVYMRRCGQTLRRRYVMPKDPQTSVQLQQRQRFVTGKKVWSDLSHAQRAIWKTYAAKLIPCKEAIWGNTGYNYYVKVQVCRQAMGLPLSADAPVGKPPGRIRKIEQLATGSPTTYAFRLDHGVRNISGMKVLVELTPAMPSAKRKPRDVELRYACVESQRSYVDLCQSGAAIVVENARYGVAEGQRYGVRVRLISAEGLTGETLTADFVRLASQQAPAWMQENEMSAKELEALVKPGDSSAAAIRKPRQRSCQTRPTPVCGDSLRVEGSSQPAEAVRPAGCSVAERAPPGNART